MKRKYWTKEELIKYFEKIADALEIEAHRNDSSYLRGKADAYRLAAFEIERNLK